MSTYGQSQVTIPKNVQHITQNIASIRQNLKDEDILKVWNETTKKKDIETRLQKYY